MIILPLSASDKAILAVVHRWVDALAAQDYVGAAVLLTPADNERDWPGPRSCAPPVRCCRRMPTTITRTRIRSMMPWTRARPEEAAALMYTQLAIEEMP